MTYCTFGNRFDKLIGNEINTISQRTGVMSYEYLSQCTLLLQGKLRR